MIELAVVLAIIGLLAGGGITLVRALHEQQMRAETADYLDEVRRALLAYANVNGKLPASDPSGTYPRIPYQTLRLRPYDEWGRSLKYVVNANLLTNKATSCTVLKNTILASKPDPKVTAPVVWDADAGSSFPVAAVIVSGGAKDAEQTATLGSLFDAYGGGNNETGDAAGNPFVRARPRADFDDLVLYIGAPTLFDWIKCD